MTEFEGKILEMLNKINDKVDKIIIKREATVITTPISAPAASVTIESTPTVKPSAVISKQKEAEAKLKGEQKYSGEGRRVCPGCGSSEFNAVPDKSVVLHYVASTPIYGKKYICRKCGKEV
ncbi:MAG: hypothetical protein ACFFAN_21020 [Promethearchaeota archaeon]